MRVIERMVALRDVGKTTCATVEVRQLVSGPRGADVVAQAHGFRSIASAWDEISAADAHAIVATLLHRDLAYGQVIMPFDKAADLATQLFDLVPEPHTYFTNGEWARSAGDSDPAELRSFNPISDATLDSGVVCLGDGRAALFWVEDED